MCRAVPGKILEVEERDVTRHDRVSVNNLTGPSRPESRSGVFAV
jgi:hypothetical protein